MMVGNSPRPRIEIKALFEFTRLRERAELGEPVATPQRPVATSRTTIKFQHLDLVARFSQLQRRRHAGQTGAKDQNGGVFHVAAKLNRAGVTGISCEPEARHSMIHRRATGYRTNQR